MERRWVREGMNTVPQGLTYVSAGSWLRKSVDFASDDSSVSPGDESESDLVLEVMCLL
jgi:hypothetical protein